jgi:hypothetical protein
VHIDEDLTEDAVRVTADLQPETVAAVLELQCNGTAAHTQAAALAHGASDSMGGRRPSVAGETAPLS